MRGKLKAGGHLGACAQIGTWHRGSFLTKSFDWGEDVRPQLAYPDVVMYHLHVRGFTKQKNSGVRHKGTFAGLREKLPYLRELGINQIRLMPVYDFAEMTPRLELKGVPKTQKEAVVRAAEQLPEEEAWRMNYWATARAFILHRSPPMQRRRIRIWS